MEFLSDVGSTFPVALLLSILSLIYVIRLLYLHLDYSLAVRRYRAEKVVQYPHRPFSFGYDLQRIHDQGTRDGNGSVVRRDLFKRYGKTFAANWMGQSVIHTMHRDNIEVVLGSSASKFIMSPLRNRIAEPLLGQGLLTQDGETWQRRRSLVMQVFGKSQIADLGTLENHLQKLLRLIPMDGSTVDLQPLFKRLFIDKGTEFLLGESINSLCPEEAHPDVDKFLTSYEKVLRVMGQRLRMGHLRFLRGLDREWRRDCREVHGVLDQFIERAKLRLHKANQSDAVVDSNVLLDKLLLATQDHAEIRTQLINVFLAGRDQIAIAMSLCLFAVARHPAVWAKLRAEVQASDSHITYESLKTMDYLRGVIFESFRLYSPVLRSIRHCNVECVLPHGGGPTGSATILVPKGTQIEMDFANMHQDQDVWGEDAEVFMPERWIGQKSPGWDYIPFLGARFAQEFQRIDNRDPELRLVEDLRNVRQSRNGTLVALIA